MDVFSGEGFFFPVNDGGIWIDEKFLPLLFVEVPGWIVFIRVRLLGMFGEVLAVIVWLLVVIYK